LKSRNDSCRRLCEEMFLGAGLVLALIFVFAPWRADALELRDFSEFLPLLQTGSTFTEQWHQLNEYYVAQGRGNVLTNGLIVAGWHVAGKSPERWQSYQFAFLVAVAVALLVFLRCAGVKRFLAIGLTMWTVCSAGPASAALRLSPELPISVLLIVLLWIGRGDGGTRALVVAAGLVACLLLLKEAAVVCLPIVLCTLAGRGRAGTRMIGIVVVAAVAVLLVVRAGAITRQAVPEAYSRGFDPQHANVITAISAARLGTPEHWPWVSTFQALQSWATLAWLTVVGAGCAVAWKSGDSLQVTGLMLTCLGGVALYAAWGRFESFYGAPFVVLQAATAGVGFASQYRRRRWIDIVVAVVMTIGALHSSTGAWRLRSWTVARRAVEFEAADKISQVGRDRQVVIAAQAQPSQAWQGNAATFTRFIAAEWPHRASPFIVDASCGASGLENVTKQAVLIYPGDTCAGLPVSGHISRMFTMIEIVPPAIIKDGFSLGTVSFE
jgi:hypothetical protein